MDLLTIIAGGFVGLCLVASGVFVNNEWQKSIVLRFGKYSRTVGSGVNFRIPFIETTITRDLRTRNTLLTSENTLTKDNIPVTVEAVMFWKISDISSSILQVDDYESNILNAAYATMRDLIGKTTLSELLSQRDTVDAHIQDGISGKAKSWGLEVASVEIRNVVIPASLQDAMSRQAQAERERQARIIMSDSEIQIAKKFDEASQVYIDNPEALKLRAMNLLYEAVKEQSTFIIVPSDMMGTMGFNGSLAATALAKAQEKK